MTYSGDQLEEYREYVPNAAECKAQPENLSAPGEEDGIKIPPVLPKEGEKEQIPKQSAMRIVTVPALAKDGNPQAFPQEITTASEVGDAQMKST